MAIEFKQVDYNDPKQAKELVALLDNYAIDPMGGGEALSADVKENLATALATRPFAISLIAYVDGEPAGLANCFEGFSTFKCKPLLNIHDLSVNPQFRGHGVGKALLGAVEEIANDRQCCKITLEVLEGNKIALNAYKKFGFKAYELDPEAGQALFMEKKLC